MKRHAQDVCDMAEANGYTHAGFNSKGARRFEHASGAVLLVQTGIDEKAARILQKQIRRVAGVAEVTQKRVPAAVRKRQARDREQHRQEMERHQAVLAGYHAKRSRMLSGYGADLTSAQVIEIERCIEREERAMAATTRLMSEVPAGRESSGSARTAKHRAGAA